jgi:hypothetical protein
MELKTPGCFGSPSAYTPGKRECAACPVTEECRVAARDRLARIKDQLGGAQMKGVEAKLDLPFVTLTIDRTSAPAKKELTVTKISGLPKKSADLVCRIQKKRPTNGLLEALVEGKNAFPDAKPEFLHMAGAMLAKGGFDRPTLKAAFMTDLNWSEGTAAAHVSLLIPALKHLGLVDEINGVLKVKRS